MSTSSTGLIASVKNPARRKRFTERKRSLDTRHLVTKPPLALKPFSGLYNPYPVRCSILCNHPADCEARAVLRRAKEQVHDNKSLLGNSDEYLHHAVPSLPEDSRYYPTSPEVPEELFRRYTDTDSRPLTPCVTLASAVTRDSVTSRRRCVTPDPPPVRTLLVLDLRRSHSQETLACCLPGMLSSQGGLTCSPTPPDVPPAPKPPVKIKTTTQPGGGGSKQKSNPDTSKVAPSQEASAKEVCGVEEEEEEEESTRRRGRKKKKKSKGGAEEGEGAGGGARRDLENEFRGLAEPGETLVSAGEGGQGGDYYPASGRSSLAPNTEHGEPSGARPSSRGGKSPSRGGKASWTDAEGRQSFLEFSMIRQLQRELNQERVDCEFNQRRRIALREALRILRPRIMSEELTRLRLTLSQAKTDSESWLSLPRMFSRKSARFELPLDSRLLSDMTPLEYLSCYVWISPGRRLLYNRVFCRHLIREGKRLMRGKNIISGLGEVMGRALTDEEAANFRGLVPWRPGLKVNFKLWCGLCALFERIYAKNFCTEFLSKEQDPCNAVEDADFETLHAKLVDNKPCARLENMLNLIKTS